MTPVNLDTIVMWGAEHWWLVFWLALWAMFCALMLVYDVTNLVRFLVNRPLRTIKVLVRGWPPAHLNADGDWRPQPKPDDLGELVRQGPVADAQGYTFTETVYRKPLATPGGSK